MRHSLFVFAAAVALTASGCDSNGIDSPGGGTPGGGNTPGGGGTPTPALTFAPVNPAATYLRTDAGTAFATPILLSDYGLAPGDTACFRMVGDADLGGGTLASAGEVRLTGAFSAGSALNAPSELNRIKDIIDGDWFVATLPVTTSGETSDIDADFDVTDDCWPVPAGAAYAFFSVYDGYFADNTDANAGGQPFGVVISEQ